MSYAILLWACLAAGDTGTVNDATGTVMDAQGRPIVGAQVQVYTARPLKGQNMICPSCYPDCRKRVTTDVAGKFRIADLDRQLLFRLLVAAAGYESQFVADVEPSAGPLKIKLKSMPRDLSAGTVLRGRVVDADGKAIAGAIVSPYGCKTATRQWYGPMPGVDPVSITDRDGQFVLRGNESALAYDLEVEARGFAKRLWNEVPVGKGLQQVQLREGAAVKGRIVENGQPVAGVQVVMLQTDRAAGVFLGPRDTTTDASGHFGLSNLAPSEEYYVCTKMAPGRRVLSPKAVTLGSDGSVTQLGELALGPVHRLAGRVILTDGKAIPSGTRLRLGRDDAWDSATIELGPDGKFLFVGVPEEAVELGTRLPGYRLASSRNRLQAVLHDTVALYVDGDKAELIIYFEPVGEADASADSTRK